MLSLLLYFANTTATTETLPVVQLAQNTSTPKTETSSMGEQLQNTTAAA